MNNQLEWWEVVMAIITCIAFPIAIALLMVERKRTATLLQSDNHYPEALNWDEEMADYEQQKQDEYLRMCDARER